MNPQAITPITIAPVTPAAQLVEAKPEVAARTATTAVTPLATRSLSAERPQLAKLETPKADGALKATEIRGSSQPAELDDADLILIWWILEG